jgi:hypothetical protein
MTSFNFVESQYKFTSPIRYFKANDPIYYEVDNIPLKQLHENDLWLKDQIFTLRQVDEAGTDRESFNELKPYVDGFDNIVKVKPGRFSARINDAYNLTPLQVISRLSFSGADTFNSWQVGSIATPGLNGILERFKQAVALDLNGLSERAFAKLAFIPDLAETRYSDPNSPKINVILGNDRAYGQPPYPGLGAVLWSNFTDNRDSSLSSTYYRVRQYDSDESAAIGFAKLGLAETAFIKKWRGVARTAIVDVPEELTIDIPEFNPEDHFYYNSQGVKVYTNATQRIDLVFIYSKPVDTSSTTIPKFVNQSPTTITAPQLGIVYGAGLGVDFRGSAERKQPVLSPAGVDKGDFPGTDNTTLNDGTIKMLSHFGDEVGSNTGFSLSSGVIRGSFPSPDDLMNIAPLLDEELSASNIALIGQTVLPVAYVVVRKDAQRNLDDGTPIIQSNDLIDIRPFFRTTELTYNERAGLAAAVPAPSIANPVVTQAELDYELKNLRSDVISRIPIIPDQPGAPTFSVFYSEREETVWFEEPILLRQADRIPSLWGTRANPSEITLDRSVLPSGDAILFPSVNNTRGDYRSYCKELILRGESYVRKDDDATYLFVSVYDGSMTNDELTELKYHKLTGNGGAIRDGNIRDTGTGGASFPNINIMNIPIKYSQLTAPNPLDAPAVPSLPFTIKVFISRASWVDRNIPGNYGTEYIDGFANEDWRLSFKLNLVGYKLVKKERFRAISMD